MRYLLDTNVCVVYINGRSETLKNRLLSLPVSDIVVCSVVKAELFFGAMKSGNPTKTLQRQQNFLSCFTSLAFDDRAAFIYGEIRAELANRGTPIGPNDLQIAAIALANNLTLVTHNTREFQRIDDLLIEDWEVDQ